VSTPEVIRWVAGPEAGKEWFETMVYAGVGRGTVRAGSVFFFILCTLGSDYDE